MRAALGVLRGNDGFVGDAAEDDNGPDLGHGRERGAEEIAAGGDLLRRRFVLRRHAPHGIGDAAIDEREAVVRTCRIITLCEAEFLERGVEEVAGIIARKRPAGAVGAAQPRSEPDNQQPRVRGTERWHRSVEPMRLFFAPGLPERNKPGTARAFAAGLVASGADLTFATHRAAEA